MLDKPIREPCAYHTGESVICVYVCMYVCMCVYIYICVLYYHECCTLSSVTLN